jgi:hypothetical protein
VSEHPDVPDFTRLRASDADRERVARVLHQAMGEGRLTVTEVDERLQQVYAAKTIGDLEPITRDLPGHELAVPVPPPVPVPAAAAVPAGPRIGGAPTSSVAVAVMSGAVRKGPWVVPETFKAVAVMGGVELDLTDARFAAPHVTIQVFALMGGVEITVPPDVTVDVRGFAFMGGFDNSVHQGGPPGSPVVHITGFALMGGVDIAPSKPRRGRPQIDS